MSEIRNFYEQLFVGLALGLILMLHFIIGRDSLDISPVIGHPYGSCFKMSMAENSSKKKKTFQLEFTDSVEDFEEMLLDEDNAGTDNRNIFDAAAFSKEVECSQKVRTAQ